jgi:CRP-like cAMP-binding protein
MTSPVHPGIWGRLDERMSSASFEQPAGTLPGIWAHLAQLVDPAEFRPKLADDVEIKEFKLRWGNDYAIIANPRELLHFDVQPNQVGAMRLMDGTRTLKEIVVDQFKESGEIEFSGIWDLVQALYAANFFDRRYVDVDEAVRRAIHPTNAIRQKVRQFTTSLSIDWHGADRFVRWIYRYFLRWCFTLWAQLLLLAVTVAGFVAFVAVVHWHRYSLSGQSLAIGFVVLLALNYFLTFMHELGHASVLVHYGRKVKGAGFAIYFGSPSFFIESSDGLMLERRQRMLQAFAGGYAEMILCGVAAMLVWLFPGAAIAPTLYKFGVLGYLVIFLNWVPLLELDGYWLFSDLIQVRDLRPMSLAFLRHDLLHKLWTRSRLTLQEIALTLYGILGVAFTVFAVYLSIFFWRTVFGGLVSKMWRGGLVTRILLILLGLLIGGPVIRAGMKLVIAILRRGRAAWNAIRFRLEKKWRVEAARLIDTLPLFEDVPADTLSELAGRVRLRTYSRGAPVVRQGERANTFYVVRKGTLQVLEEEPVSGNERVLRVLGRGEAFGELGLADAAPRSATVRALEESEVFEIDKGTFDRLLADMIHLPEFAPSLQAVAELRELPCFAHLEPDDLSQLFHHGEWVNIPPGEPIIEEGEVGDAFYAIRSGQADVFEGEAHVRTVGPGSAFGENALLFDVPRTATVIARTPLRAFRLNRIGFDKLVAGAYRRGTLDPHIIPDRTWQH